MQDEDGSAIVYALRDVAPGEELTLDYMGVKGLTLAERRAKLSGQYFFECACTQCLEEEMTKGAQVPGGNLTGKKREREESALP